MCLKSNNIKILMWYETYYNSENKISKIFFLHLIHVCQNSTMQTGLIIVTKYRGNTS